MALAVFFWVDCNRPSLISFAQTSSRARAAEWTLDRCSLLFEEGATDAHRVFSPRGRRIPWTLKCLVYVGGSHKPREDAEALARRGSDEPEEV